MIKQPYLVGLVLTLSIVTGSVMASGSTSF